MKRRSDTRAEHAPGEIRVGMISLGCAKNLVDGEMMLGHLQRAGAAITADAAAADVVIVNTCGFIDDAKRESIDAILEADRQRRDLLVRVETLRPAGMRPAKRSPDGSAREHRPTISWPS